MPIRLRSSRTTLNPVIVRLMAENLRTDDVDRRILACLVEDGRSTYDDVGRRVALSAPAVKRRVDRLRARGVLRGFTALVDPAALGATTEALIELFYAPGIGLEAVRESLRPLPEVVEAWSVTGDADCIVRVRATDPQDLERVIMELQRESSVVRTRSQVIMSRLIERRD
jgi:Lrp/AsnC family leucine-responsive transcriptional regulator